MKLGTRDRRGEEELKVRESFERRGGREREKRWQGLGIHKKSKSNGVMTKVR